MKKDFTKGSIWKSITTLSVPIVGQQLLQSAYQIIDTFWVGRLGADAVAAVSLSFPVLFFAMALGFGLAIGGSVLVSQAAGRKSLRDIEHFSTQSTVAVILVSIGFATIGYLLSEPAMRLLGASDSVLPLATSYLQVMFLGLPFLFGYFAYMSVTRSVGEVKIPLYIVGATVILNAVLDPLFIYGYGILPAYGVAGAAWASFATQGLSMLIGIILMMKGTHGFRLHLKDAIPEKDTWKKIFAIGLPASFETAARSIALICMAAIIALLGTKAVAAYGIGLRIFSFVIIPAVGVSLAVSTLVGQNVGANKLDRAQETVSKSMAATFWFLTLVGVILFVFARPVTAFFIAKEPEVVRMATLFLQIMSLSFGFIGLQMAIIGGFRGTGHTVAALLTTSVTLFIIQVPLAFVLSQYTQLAEKGVWIALTAANVLGAGIAYAWYKHGSWKVPTSTTR